VHPIRARTWQAVIRQPIERMTTAAPSTNNIDNEMISNNSCLLSLSLQARDYLQENN
jgi:hypothetical protein